ncbi:hypothetical protein [Halosimplex sp. TS25]|uniref:hypothetical protein n=1 Tax=Halosimplex rarum TaxID=3396619 RepID=UPI0039E74F03
MPTDDTQTKESIASETDHSQPSRREFLGTTALSALPLSETQFGRDSVPEIVAAEVAATYVDPARSDLVGKQPDPQRAVQRLEHAVIRLRDEATHSLDSEQGPESPPAERPSDDSPIATFSVPPNFEREIRAQYHRHLVQTNEEAELGFDEFLDEVVTIRDDPARGLSISFEG